jgi:hypothetical protein
MSNDELLQSDNIAYHIPVCTVFGRTCLVVQIGNYTAVFEQQ